MTGKCRHRHTRPATVDDPSPYCLDCGTITVHVLAEDRALNLPQFMCPNCVTPWKCNGPHLQDQVRCV